MKSSRTTAPVLETEMGGWSSTWLVQGIGSCSLVCRAFKVSVVLGLQREKRRERERRYRELSG